MANTLLGTSEINALNGISGPWLLPPDATEIDVHNQFNSTGVMTLQVQYSHDNFVNDITVGPVIDPMTGATNAATTWATTGGVSGYRRSPVPSGKTHVRIRATAYTSGARTVSVFARTVQSLTYTVNGQLASVGSLTSANLGIPVYIADQASGAITTSATTAALTPSYGTSYESKVFVTSVSGTSPTLDVAIEESDDNGSNWYRVWEFPRITTNGSYRSPKLPMSGTRIRYVQTIGGTSPSFTRSLVRLQASDTSTVKRQRFDRAVSLTSVNSPTVSVFSAGAKNAQLVVALNEATTPPSLVLEGSEDGARWYQIGTPLATVASSTVQLTVSNINTYMLRAKVSTAGVTVTPGYVCVKVF